MRRPIGWTTMWALQVGLAGAAEAPPDWLAKALAREGEPQPEVALAGVEDSFKARVPAKVVALPLAHGETQYVTFDIGAPTAMECWIYDGEKDPAQSLRGLSEETFKALAARQGTIETKVIQQIDAGAVGSSPFLAVDWIYRVRDKEGAKAGQVKHVIAAKDDRSIHCLHAELGYAATFRRVFFGLVESIEFAERGPAPYYVEISTASVGDRRVGYIRFAFFRDEDGDTRIVDQTSMLLPVDAQTLASRDSYRVQFSDAEGGLLNELAVDAEQGEVVTRLALDPLDNGGWKVSGTLQAKPFEAALPATELKSELGDRLAFRELARTAAPGSSLKYMDWTDEDPGRLNEVEINVGKVADQGVDAVLKTAQLSMDVVLDREGSLKTGRMSMGAHTLEIQRIHVEGSVPAASN